MGKLSCRAPSDTTAPDTLDTAMDTIHFKVSLWLRVIATHFGCSSFSISVVQSSLEEKIHCFPLAIIVIHFISWLFLKVILLCGKEES